MLHQLKMRVVKMMGRCDTELAGEIHDTRLGECYSCTLSESMDHYGLDAGSSLVLA